MQAVRFFLSKPVPLGDSFFQTKFSIISVKDLKGKAIRIKKDASGFNLGIFLDQISTVYIHHGKGRPQINMSCLVHYPKKQPVVVDFKFKNTSIWMLRPAFSAAQDGKPILDKQKVTPMMGMTEGTRQLQLPKGTKAPLHVTWTSSEGVSGALTCSAASA